jgi:hypothetical protein
MQLRREQSFRRVSVVVDAVVAVAADADAAMLTEVVAAVGAERGRVIEITTARLGPGVCGQRRAYPDRDIVVLAPELPDPDRTLAHELGHVVFGHDGAPASEVTLEAGDDLIAYMLNMRASSAFDDGADELSEWEAETFAGMLLTRLRVLGGRGSRVAALRYDEALG